MGKELKNSLGDYMTGYSAPLQDMQFVLHEVQGAEALFASMEGTAEVSRDLIDAVLESAAKIAQEVLAPINRSGDEEGCRLEQGKVFTPKGFKEAYTAFAEGGWIGLSGDPQYGGQGMPKVLAVLFEEMIMAANSSFALYPILSAGASLALARHGSEELKQRYLPKLYSGQWSGTMCLTEAHAGTDLGIIKTRAVPNADGSYQISGTKIFITGGDHDLNANIIHLVLAKLPDAPEGPKGISLFVVPRHLDDEAGDPSKANNVSCGAIEHKMGIKGSATCVLNFDDAQGFLVGEPNKGLNYMFTMMNYERLSIGLQGLGLADSSYRSAAQYARERVQGRSAHGVQDEKSVADPILEHADVRRMLLTVRADTEAGRALAVYVASQLDVAHFHGDEQRRARAAKLVALLTPVAKAAFSDRGFEGCVMAQQVLGGHGYVREWGLEQNVRDARIAQIYEGTNGIQALDLAGRKLVRDRDELLEVLIDEIETFIAEHGAQESLASSIAALKAALSSVVDVSAWLKEAAQTDADEIGGASVPYLRLMTLLLYAFMWARMERAAHEGLANNSANASFYDAKLKTAAFFRARMMPNAQALVGEIKGGCAVLMTMDADQF